MFNVIKYMRFLHVVWKESEATEAKSPRSSTMQGIS